MIIIADELKLRQDSSANLLIKTIEQFRIEDCNVYYNFPFYRGETLDDVVKAHVLLVSREYGVIFFRCLESIEDYNSTEIRKLDDLDGHIMSKIFKRDEFKVDRRTFKINVTPKIFITNYSGSEPDIISQEQLRSTIFDNKVEELSVDEFNLLVAVIEGTVNLKKKSDRALSQDKETLNKGKVLSIIQNREATFDIEQKRAALNIIDSPQRIRGLAGSGKTVILAMKAALYHLQNPEAKILYTYYTKALYEQVKYLIEKFYRDFSDNQEPDWNKIHILHGWGGNSLAGVYSEVCFHNQIPRISFTTAKNARPSNPFSYICERLNEHELKEIYDLTLIDEGQDFNRFFYQICYKITRYKRIVWAYDDFQNIFDIEMQDEKETFGKNESGEYFVDFSRKDNILQDIILHKCYRNPRYVLTSAFALGLGIYNNKVLQRLENNKHWEDLGFKVLEGESNEGDNMVIERPLESSPIETNDYFDTDSISINLFNSLEEETDYICNEIFNDIFNESLNPEDICVISLDQKNVANYFDSLSKKLTSREIRVFNLLNAPNNNTNFSVKGNVTLSTINKAKGNEVGMVYVLGVDSAFNNRDSIRNRNQLFTAITRSKGWVKLTGFINGGSYCYEEMQKLKENNYLLNFIQPNYKTTKTILRGMDKVQSELNTVSRVLEGLSAQTGIPIEELIKNLDFTGQKK